MKQFVAREVCTSGPPRPRAARLLYGAPPPPAPPSALPFQSPNRRYRLESRHGRYTRHFAITRPIFSPEIVNRPNPSRNIPNLFSPRLCDRYPSNINATLRPFPGKRVYNFFPRVDEEGRSSRRWSGEMRTPALGRAAWPRKITESLIVSGLATLYAVCNT